MTPEQERLASDPTIPESLRVALEEDAAMEPSAGELAQMSAGLGLSSAPIAPVAGSKLATFLPFAVPLAILGVGVVAITIWMGQPPAPSVPHKQVNLRVPSAAPPALAPVISAPPPEAPPVATHRPVARPVDSTPSSTLAEEMRLISRAEHMVSIDPQRALALAQEHHRRFPNGLLGEESEVVAIHALVRLGRRAEAEQRARAFEQAHGSSVHLRRVRRVLSDSPE